MKNKYQIPQWLFLTISPIVRLKPFSRKILLSFLLVNFIISVNGQCLFTLDRVNDNTAILTGTGVAISTSGSNNTFFVWTAEVFEPGFTASTVTGIPSSNTLTVNGVVFNNMSSSNTSWLNFNLASPVGAGSLTATGSVTLTWPVGAVLKAQGSSFDVDHPFGNTLCSVSVSTAGPVPTLSEWGLIIFSLLLLIFGVVAIRVRNTRLALAGTEEHASAHVFTLRNLPFGRSLYFKILAAVALGMLALFGTAIIFFEYELTSADPFGILLAIPLASYFIQLLVAKQEK